MRRSIRALSGATAPLALLLAAPALAQSGPSTEPTPQDRTRQRLAAPLAESYPEEATGDGVTTGGYNQSRWAEDWSRMRNPANRTDFIDRLKFLPLAGDDVYVTLSGELRLRSNLTTNPDLKDVEAQRQDINRINLGADLHVGKFFRAYGELAHAGISGPNIGAPSGLLRNDLIVQQSFVEASGEVTRGLSLGVRYGRQTFADGPNLMVVPRDNNTILFTFNGVRAWAQGKSVRVDLFDFTPTRPGQSGTGDDLNEDGRRFSGVSGGLVLPKSLFGGSELYADPFVWRLRNRAAVWGGQTAREVRNFYGLHLWGDAGPVNIDWTINRQTGDYDGRDISAWLLLFAQSYRIGKGATAPRVGFHADYASGGGAYGNGTLRTSLAPFGNNIYYSYQLYATPTNLIAVAPNFSFTPVKKVRASLEYQLSWRDDVRDAVYRANGTAFAGTQNFDSAKIADTLRAQIVWTITPRLSFTGRYEHLIAGPALTRAGYSSSDFVAGWLSFRF